MNVNGPRKKCMWQSMVIALSCGFLSACGGDSTILSSKSISVIEGENGPDYHTVIPGLIYSLPQTLVNLTVTVGEKKFPTAEQAQEISALRKKSSNLEGKIKTMEKALEANENNNVRQELNKAKLLRSATIKQLEKVLSEVTVQRGVSASAELAAVTPDPSHTYRLTYEHSGISHDDVEIRTSPSGLLKSISTTARDESIALVKEVVDVAGDAAVFVATGAIPLTLPAKAQAVNGECANEENFSATFLMNPILDGGLGSYTNVTNNLNELSSIKKDCFSVRVYDAMLNDAKPMDKVGRCVDSKKGTATSSCIFYRRLGTLFIHVTHKGLPQLTDLILVQVPQAGPIGSIEVLRRAFVENVAEVTFTDGMLTRLKLNEPSQTKAVASAPFDLLREIFSIPAAIVDTRTSRVNSEANLLKARAALIEAQILLENLRAGIQDQQTTGAGQ